MQSLGKMVLRKPIIKIFKLALKNGKPLLARLDLQLHGGLRRLDRFTRHRAAPFALNAAVNTIAQIKTDTMATDGAYTSTLMSDKTRT